MKKTVVIGLDGLSPELLNVLIEKGRLPTIKKLTQEGVYAQLESTSPPVTGPAWTSFATGKNPENHGCYDFLLPRKSLTQLKTITSEDIQGETFYEALDSSGKKSILINLPNSYPPLTGNVTITSLMTKGDDCVFPEELKEEVDGLEGYRITPDTSLKTDSMEKYFKDIRDLERNRFEVAKKLFRDKEWDVFFILFSGSDWVQHEVYEKLEKSSLGEESEAYKLYEDLDGYVKWFKDEMEEEGDLFVLSDHGFEAKKGLFFLNEWLKRNGYLTLRKSSSKNLPHRMEEELGKSKREVKVPGFISENLGMFEFLAPVAAKIARKLNLKFKMDTEPDPEESIAYMPRGRSDSIYLNLKGKFEDGTVDEENREEMLEELASELEKLEDENSEGVIEGVELKGGPDGPDLVLKPDQWLTMAEASPTTLQKLDINGHEERGVFIAYGSDVKGGEKLDNASIIDLAPTILHMMGEKIPKDVDGSVLKNLMKEGSEPGERRVKYKEPSIQRRTSEGKDLKVKNRLKKLGYIE